MTRRIRLGISTCPNDTFAFHALLSGALIRPGLQFEIELHDVQELNEALGAGSFEVCKASFAAGFERASEWCLLPVGAALGKGNGPLVLARDSRAAQHTAPRVLGPGRQTTAELLYRLFHPGQAVQSMLFSEIMGALERDEAELGICIHEGRFTYRERGLQLVEDLGLRWEAETDCDLPLGGIFARKSLGQETLREVQSAIEASLAYARANPSEALRSMRRYAQEQSAEVLQGHVELYVNDNTRQLSCEGQRAIERLEAEARRAGLCASDAARLTVFGTHQSEGSP